MKTIIRVLIPVLVIAGAAFWYMQGNSEAATRSFRFVTVERGNIESVVSSTGTLEPVTTVEVGTQVSGILSNIYVDFNDHVQAGQIIAVLDTTLLGVSVREARVALARNEAQLRHAQRTYERQNTLAQQNMLPEADLDQALYELESARASLTSSQINLERAQRNLSYATISAPISGTVIERNVDVGQTVAASFSAPQLFLIANDLAQMHILASVDESDIGQIHEGQAARFTVQAYPDASFNGTVDQVRLQYATEENVVNYSVVINVDNSDGRLLPGMTATVEFITQTSTNVLKVANAALRYSPSSDIMQELMERRRAEMQARRAARSDSTQRRPERPPVMREGQNRQSGSEDNRGRLFYLDESGQLSIMPIRTGITDGQYTEVMGRNLTEGLQVISGISTQTAATQSSSNPFQSNERSGRRRGPPPGAF